jgi:fatty-acyl-CoA synthase
MNNKAPWHARLARILAIVLPLFLVAAALGTKFGLWGWELGLGAFALGGLVLIGLTLLAAIVSIVLILRSGSRLGLLSAGFGMVVALGFVALFAPLFAGAGSHPIHDMATDTANPPAFSAQVLAARAKAGANPLNAYDTPLGETEQFAGTQPPLSDMTTAQIVTEKYPELEPLEIGETDKNEAVNAIQLAMADMGFTDIRYNPEGSTIEGVAETFWFGFKDDVVARVSESAVDFRSVSRVGQSDLGANAKRIMELRERTAEKLDL